MTQVSPPRRTRPAAFSPTGPAPRTTTSYVRVPAPCCASSVMASTLARLRPAPPSGGWVTGRPAVSIAGRLAVSARAPPSAGAPLVKSAVETLNPTRVKLTVEVPYDELKPSLDAAYKTISSQVTVPGFRKGKVPPRIID